MAADGIYVAALTRKGRRVTLAHCTVVRLRQAPVLPEDLVEERGRADLLEALQVLAPGGIDVSRPYFALSGTACFIKRHFALPDAGDATRDHLMWEAGQLLGRDIEEFVIEVLITTRCGFLVAVRRQILELYGALCRHAGLGPPGFDMTSFALCNALESCGAGGVGAEIILRQEPEAASAVLLRDGVYEGEQAWDLDSLSVPDGLARFAEAELVEGDAAPRLWLAGGAGGSGLPGFEEIAELDPFAGMSVADEARQALQNADTPPGAFAVAVGLAVRGLADA